jgi:hypothetical protein
MRNQALKILLALLVLGSVARAQPMMDPRAISGQSRPDATIPAGTIRVKVVHGELSRNAEPGTVVALVAMTAGGSATVATQAVDGQGHASFAGLDTSGATAYYACTILGGDRLQSLPMSPRPDAGIALMLAARKLDAAGSPLGSPVDDSVGKDGKPAAPGTASVSVQGVGLKAGTPVEIVDLGQARPVVVGKKVLAAEPGAAGAFSVAGIPLEVAEGTVLMARVRRRDGKVSTSAPAIWHVGAGLHLAIFAVDRVVVGGQIFAGIDGDHLHVQAELTVGNVAAAPIVPGPGGLVIPLAEGAHKVALEPAAGASIVDDKLVITRPLPPGGTPFEVSFELPISDGKIAVSWPLPLGLFQSTLAIERTPDGVFTPPAGQQAEELESDKGETFWVIKNLTLSAGTPLTFAATGMVGNAAAEVEGGGQPMMDPRQTSGHSRGDAEVSLGTIRATVLRGALRQPAPVGTKVILVGLESGGKLSLHSAVTDKDGHASFAGLDVRGEIAYYAYTNFGGDRLESEIMTLDKMGGTALMLAGRKVDASGKPIGKPVDDALPEGTAPVPAGEVHIQTRGVGLAPGLPIELVEVAPAGEPRRLATTQLRPDTSAKGEGGTFLADFSGVQAAEGAILVARLTIGDKVYLSKPWMHRGDAGVSRVLLAVDRLLVSIHMAGELDDLYLRCQVQVAVQNASGVPYVPPKEGILIPLPEGASQPSLDGENPGIVIDGDKNIVIKRTLAPGTTTVVAGFGLRIENGTVAGRMRLPHGLTASSLAFEHVAGASFVPPAGAGVDEVEGDDGRVFWAIRQLQEPPGQTITWTLSGLPERPRSERLARSAAGLTVLFLIALAVYVTFFRKDRRRPGTTGDLPTRKKALEQERERLYEALVQLERARVKKGGDAELDRTRSELVAKLTTVLHELDELEAGRAPA